MQLCPQGDKIQIPGKINGNDESYNKEDKYDHKITPGLGGKTAHEPENNNRHLFIGNEF